MQLIDIRDEKHLKTYTYYLTDENVDVDVEEMKRSDSKDKYVKVSCLRETMLLTIDSAQTSSQTSLKFYYELTDSSEISSDVPPLSNEIGIRTRNLAGYLK